MLGWEWEGKKKEGGGRPIPMDCWMEETSRGVSSLIFLNLKKNNVDRFYTCVSNVLHVYVWYQGERERVTWMYY